MGLQEINVNWNRVPAEHRLPNRTRHWFEAIFLRTAFLPSSSSTSSHRFGGVSLWSIGKSAHHVDPRRSGFDSLGRWSWTTYRGKDSKSLCVITAYRPNLNKYYEGSVWYQQSLHLMNNDRSDECPLAKFDKDLCQFVDDTTSPGTSIVLGIDANTDLTMTGLKEFRTLLQNVGLHELIITQHAPTPPTRKTGRTTIDGIFVSSNLDCCRCGYTGWVSDHCGTYIDIPMQATLGRVMPPVVSAKARRLKLEDPRIVQKFLHKFRQQVDSFQGRQRLQTLFSNPIIIDRGGHPLPSTSAERNEFTAEYEDLDKRILRAFTMASRKCRKFKTGTTAWSPNYQSLREPLTIINTLIKFRRAKRYSTPRELRRKAILWGIPDCIRWSKSKLKRESQRRTSELKAFKPTSDDIRDTFAHQLSQRIAIAKGTKASDEYDRRMAREKIRLAFRVISTTMPKSQHRGPLSMVETPDSSDPTKFRQCTTQQAMELAIENEITTRFRQASHTSFLQPPLRSLVGDIGVTPEASELLRGNIPSTLPTDVQSFLRQVKYSNEEAISIVPDLESYRSNWKRQREATSSHPGRHFGHIMACMQDPDLADMLRHLEYLPLLTGFSPNSWRRCTDIMIEKKPGNFQVSKLRAILLFDALANHAFKQVGRSAMYSAESLNAIAKEQGGSRKHHRAIHLALQKRLTFDLSRQFKQPLALCSNDAKSCYDRIVHSIAAMSLQSVGVPIEPIVCMFTTIQRLEHHIRTVYGDSKTFFGGDASVDLYAVPIQGVGQGNGAAPQIWALVSTPILNLLRQDGYGFAFQAALRPDDTINFVGYAFVDDSDIGITSPQLTVTETAARMQQAADLWQNGLYHTGGALVPEKSFWYLVDYQWSHGQWSYRQETQIPASLSITGPDGVRCELRRLSHNEAAKTLGVYLAPTGNDSTQCQQLRKKSQAWATKLRSARLPKHMAWTAFHTTITKTLQYPLLATCIEKADLTRAQAPALTAALNASGIGKDIPCAIRHAPLSHKGLNIPDLYLHQELQHLLTIIECSHNLPSVLSDLIRHSLHGMKLELGLNGTLFDHPFSRYKDLVTPCWVRHSWKHSQALGLRLEDTLPDFPLRRVGDECLMKIFTRLGLTPNELVRVNLCRKYLQVVTLSEICNADGKSILRNFYDGQRNSANSSSYLYHWVNQGKPSEVIWHTWRQTLARLCGRNLQLRQSMSAECYAAVRTDFRFFYCPVSERVFERTATSWHLYIRSSGRTRGQQHTFRRVNDSVPDLNCSCDFVASVFFRNEHTLVLTGFSPVASPTLEPSTLDICNLHPTHFSSCLKDSLPHKVQWILDHVRFPSDISGICQSIATGACYAVSDGSYYASTGTGTASMTIQWNAQAPSIEGDCISPGNKDDQCSYRSELIGLYMIVVVVHLLELQFALQGSITIGCDGLSALTEALRIDVPSSTATNHFDIISAIRFVVRKSAIRFQSQHVYGHQRDRHLIVELPGQQHLPSKGVASGPLDYWATMNDDMDSRAKAFHHAVYVEQTTPLPQHDRLWFELWPCLLSDGNKVTCKLYTTVRDYITAAAATNYYAGNSRRKFGTEALPSEIDFRPSQLAMKSQVITRRIFQSKLSSTFLPVTHRLRIRKQSTHARCPCCQHHQLSVPSWSVCEDETVSHLLTCSTPSAQQRWSIALEDLDTWFDDHDTEPEVAESILNALRQWSSSSPITISSDYSDDLQHILRAQTRVGWQAFFEGFPVSGWSTLQDQWYRLQPSCSKTGERWLSQLIQKFFDVSWDLWQHRNGILHQTTQNIRLLELQQKIRDEFRLGNPLDIPAIDRLLRPGLTKILRRRKSNLEMWLYAIDTHRRFIPLPTRAERFVAAQSRLMRRLFLTRDS